MDPFKLTVKQVNFEAEDLPFIDNLDSFGWTISSLEDFRLQLQVDEQKSPYISFCTEVDKTRRARRNCRLARPFPLGRKRTASDSDLHRVIRELEYIPDDCREAAPSRDPFQEVGVHQAAPWRLAAGDVFPSLRVASVATDSLRTASTDTSGSCATVCSQSYGGTAVSTGATRGQQQWLQVNGRVSPEARQAVRDSKSVAELSQTFRGLGISSHEPVKEPTAVPVSSLLSVYRYKDLELTRQACKTGFICRRPTVDYSPVKLSLEPPVLSTVCDTPVLVNNSPSSSYSPVKVTAVSVTTVTGKTCRIHTKTIISETEAKQGTPQWLQAYTITRMSSNIESDVHVTPIVSRQSGVQDSLTALTETTEALALQESVIGGATVKPAPPDVVAAVIAESQRKYRLKMASDQGHGSRTFEGGDDASLPVGTELFELMESAEGGSPSGESKKRKAKKGNKKDQKRKWLERAKELDKEIDNTSTVSVSSQAMDTSGDASMSTSLLVSQVKHASDACDNDDDATLEGALTEEELSSLQDLTADIPHGGYVPPTERPTRSGSPPTERPTRSGSPPTRDDSSSCAAPFHFATSTPARDCDTTTSSVYFTPASAGAATSGGGSDYYELLREKSHLEGRLEAVMADGRASLREKSELKAELARSRSRLRSQADASHVAAGERDASVADLASLRGHREQLERSLVALQGALEEKAAEMGLAQVALSGMRETNEGLQARIDELKTELQAKEGVVKDLKDKIVELHVELQTTVQEKMQADNSSRSLKNEMAATLSAKDWYQEQLKFAQEVRSKIQKELAQLQTSAVVQGSLVEKLRSENAQVRQQLLESQQRAMQDKESLARNLETIQADIMEREAAFEQVEREKNMTQESIRTKLHATEEERSKMFTLTIKSTELEHQLELATNELKVREAALATFEDQQKELLSRLALSQEAIATKDLEHDEVTQQYMELQSKLAALQKDMDARDADIHRLKESKAAVEVQLSSAQDEKKVFDLALQKLKGDMNRVEHSYRLMRQELNVKSTRLEEVQRDKDRLEMELAAAQEQVQTRMDVTAHQVAASAMDDLRTQRLGYEEELMKLRQAKQSMMSTCQGLDKEKDGLQQALLTTHKRFSDLEMHLQDALGQRAALEQQVSEMTAVHTLGADKQQKQSHKELSKQKAKVVRLMKELEEVRDELERKQDEYNSKVNVLTQQLQTASAVRSKAEDELRHLNQAETTAVPPDSAADLTGRDAELLAVESADVDDAAADACRDVVVSEGDGVLPEADQGADDAGRRASATEQAGGASMQLMLALQQLENTREEKEDLEEQLEEVSNLFKSSVEEYQQHIAGLQVALEQARADASEHQTEELARCLQLELEKEKGRLA
ncbi:PREDICTED: golgin subfamily A member 3-like, partial [Priapulus caudatus]|uniref:Golgin subfamily A member 3-like n=1 Tax=Priapulus caudatus TaxID=37621 RepID=A0ABM1F2E8_PRICU